MKMLQELNEAILYFSGDGTPVCVPRTGRPVKLPGVGTFTPSVDREGTFKLNYRADQGLKDGLNAPAAYTGEVRLSACSHRQATGTASA